MTHLLLPDHLTPVPCLLSHMNWLLHHLLIISSSSQDMLPHLPLPLHNHPSLRFCTPAAPTSFPSDASTPYPPSLILMLPHLHRTLTISLQICNCMSTLTHTYASAPPPRPHNFPPMLLRQIHPHPSLCFFPPPNPQTLTVTS
ncbi:hypothetical protein O181_071612 [Austropuccinia psidii MF-1]|uniref:Uncharacterized protein n=1 Tax=Austropuccinia psidii MF-1 TaxID=1389203 RepID=A0A9Q3I9C3_9BASI|nr:hypothetical protein [Austropuccinia psidii MF-1]